MELTIYLPNRVFLQRQDVLSLVAEGPNGYIGLLPNRLDCVLPLVPGILTVTGPAGPLYLAIDQGLLIKTGPRVQISVRHAVDGAALGELRQTVQKEFLQLDEQEKQTRRVVAQLESGFIRRLLAIQKP